MGERSEQAAAVQRAPHHMSFADSQHINAHAFNINITCEEFPAKPLSLEAKHDSILKLQYTSALKAAPERCPAVSQPKVLSKGVAGIGVI
eukprot:6307026-Amphidinium_carterae.2